MDGWFLVSFNSGTRAATGRAGGDEVEVRLEVDDSPRAVGIPQTLQAALDSDPGADTVWKSSSDSTLTDHAMCGHHVVHDDLC